MTATGLLRKKIGKLPNKGFIRVVDFRNEIGKAAKPAAIEQAFSRLAKAGEINRVGKGVYWKAPKSRFGVVPPPRFDAALAVAADRAPGPAGSTAAAFLGLTTQVPAVQEIAVIGRESTAIPGTVFRERVNPKRDGLKPAEIAVLEVVRDGFRYCEKRPEEAIARFRELACDGRINIGRLATAALGEGRAVREVVESLR